MKVVKLIYVLYKIKLLSPLGMYRLLVSFYRYGINLMTLLHIAERKYADHVALLDDMETLNYKQLLSQSKKLAYCLKEDSHIEKGQKVGILCRNHASLVKSIFALSQLGADIYLLNTEISKTQFHKFANRHNFNVVIFDNEFGSYMEQSHDISKKILSYHHHLPAINNFLHSNYDEVRNLERTSMGKIVLQTSGTTGTSKEAAHKPSLFNYLNPFVELISRLQLINYHTAYVATPIYHGYGIAILLLFIPLGKKVVISSDFDSKKACHLIREHQVEVATVVPLMLQRMLSTNSEDLGTLSCVASGGAKLSEELVDNTVRALGNVLYNLYGTSEAGLNIIATPQDLMYSTYTIGKKIKGVRLKVLDDNWKEVQVGKIGQICIRNKWSMSNKNSSWIETGDLGYRDDHGYFFLRGRTDDMVVSGGENVYPIEMEHVLLKHPFIEDVAVIGVSDEQFGERLKAIVLPVRNTCLTEKEILEWLRTKVARFQMPREVVIVQQMPYTNLGKLDRKKLI
ncbi:AMP-binding protein [Ornithinibacillus salinisoli]|uniref:AMP-binding protein n=1 Tax=Ornithinibacillus salinisoli TaxID=1848459 RepID=A0ABW4W141_9BACI